jgi:hypothetical protein
VSSNRTSVSKRPSLSWLSIKAKDIVTRPLKCPLGTGLTIIGLAGLADDVETWQKLFNRMTRDERVLVLAEKAADFASWLNQPEVRVALVLLGIILLAWRLPAVWRFRHKLIFKWRAKLSEIVWIDREAAITLMKNSEWGQIKRPNTSILDFKMPATTGLTPSERSRTKFRLYIELSLDSFAEDNWDSVRQTDEGEEEYNETVLRKFVGSAMKSEIEEQFGSIPSGSVA